MYNNSRDKKAEHLRPEMEFLCNLLFYLFLFMLIAWLTSTGKKVWTISCLHLQIFVIINTYNN